MSGGVCGQCVQRVMVKFGYCAESHGDYEKQQKNLLTKPPFWYKMKVHTVGEFPYRRAFVQAVPVGRYTYFCKGESP